MLRDVTATIAPPKQKRARAPAKKTRGKKAAADTTSTTVNTDDVAHAQQQRVTSKRNLDNTPTKVNTRPEKQFRGSASPSATVRRLDL